MSMITFAHIVVMIDVGQRLFVVNVGNRLWRFDGLRMVLMTIIKLHVPNVGIDFSDPAKIQVIVIDYSFFNY